MSIAEEIRRLHERLQREMEGHKDMVQQIYSEIAAVQARCPHTNTTYHPDASGNNDWHRECIECGKEGKRL